MPEGPEGEGAQTRTPAQDRGDAARPPTIDDVERLGSGGGVAVGCTVLVALAIALFWVLRGFLLR